MKWSYTQIWFIKQTKMVPNQNQSNESGLVALVIFLMLVFTIWAFSSCTTNHYFSVNADEMTNPRIEYHDSTTVSNPF